MAQKRKAQEAFGGQRAQLSAFAAAKLRRQAANAAPTPPPPPAALQTSPERTQDVAAAEVATEPYDGHHSGRTSPRGMSEDEDDNAPNQAPGAAVALSTFVPRADNVSHNDEKSFEFTLRENETATFVGEYEIRVTQGIITIYGAVLRQNSPPRRVYALAISALPQIQARQDNTSVRVSSVHSGLRKLPKLSPHFRNLWAADSKSGCTFDFLTTTDDDALERTLYPVEIDRDMDLTLRTISARSVADRQQPRIMAIGGKSSGKSTFNRILSNHLHSWTQGRKSLYLDLDPGQPEFGPPGQLSLVEVCDPLLGPAFTHPASLDSSSFRIIRSHTIAATTFKDDPAIYKECAKDLIRHAQNKHPLIVNACGWTSGLGASVLVDLVSELAITDIVWFEPMDVALAGSLHSISRSPTFHKITRQAPRPSIRSPAELRAMQTMSYFHSRLNSCDSLFKISGKAVGQMRYWNVLYSPEHYGITAIMSYNHNPSPEFLAEVLDGSVVAVVVLGADNSKPIRVAEDGTEMLRDVTDYLSRTAEGLPYVTSSSKGIDRTLDPTCSYCIGMAFIRGICFESKTLQLVTPLPEQQINDLSEKQVVLVRGSFDSPGWAYLEDVYKNESNNQNEIDIDERPWISERDSSGIESRVWRMRHPPLAK